MSITTFDYRVFPAVYAGIINTILGYTTATIAPWDLTVDRFSQGFQFERGEFTDGFEVFIGGMNTNDSDTEGPSMFFNKDYMISVCSCNQAALAEETEELGMLIAAIFMGISAKITLGTFGYMDCGTFAGETIGPTWEQNSQRWIFQFRLTFAIYPDVITLT